MSPPDAQAYFDTIDRGAEGPGHRVGPDRAASRGRRAAALQRRADRDDGRRQEAHRARSPHPHAGGQDPGRDAPERRRLRGKAGAARHRRREELVRPFRLVGRRRRRRGARGGADGDPPGAVEHDAGLGRLPDAAPRRDRHPGRVRLRRHELQPGGAAGDDPRRGLPLAPHRARPGQMDRRRRACSRFR